MHRDIEERLYKVSKNSSLLSVTSQFHKSFKVWLLELYWSPNFQHFCIKIIFLYPWWAGPIKGACAQPATIKLIIPIYSEFIIFSLFRDLNPGPPRGALTIELWRRLAPFVGGMKFATQVSPLLNFISMSFLNFGCVNFRIIMKKARTECQSHKLTVEDPVTLEYITRYVAGMKQR